MFDKDKIYNQFNLKAETILIPKYGKRSSATIEEVLETLFLFDKAAAQKLGMTNQSLRKYIKQLFPDLELKSLSNRSWESWFLSFGTTKRCCKCQEIKERNLFSKDKSTPDGLKHECKLCIHERTSTEEYKSKWSDYNKRRYQKI